MDLEEAFLQAQERKNKFRTIRRSASGVSWMLESIVHLYASLNWKQTLKAMWPRITRIHNATFVPDNSVEFLRWHTEEGKNHTRVWKERKTWHTLLIDTQLPPEHTIPKKLVHQPGLLLLFLLVYPHRVRSDIVMWLDKELT
jgi:hypothetical protein